MANSLETRITRSSCDLQESIKFSDKKGRIRGCGMQGCAEPGTYARYERHRIICEFSHETGLYFCFYPKVCFFNQKTRTSLVIIQIYAIPEIITSNLVVHVVYIQKIAHNLNTSRIYAGVVVGTFVFFFH